MAPDIAGDDLNEQIRYPTGRLSASLLADYRTPVAGPIAAVRPPAENERFATPRIHAALFLFILVFLIALNDPS